MRLVSMSKQTCAEKSWISSHRRSAWALSSALRPSLRVASWGSTVGTVNIWHCFRLVILSCELVENLGCERISFQKWKIDLLISWQQVIGKYCWWVKCIELSELFHVLPRTAGLDSIYRELNVKSRALMRLG